MINSVRNTVLAILNKNNYGYLSPSDFNLFAKQAQLDIFEQYFIDYNTQINRENARVSGTEYADIRKAIEEAMEVFFEIKDLTQDTDNKFFLPSLPTTGDDYFMVNKILCYDVDDEDVRTFRGEAEKVTHSKITMLVNSNLTQPTKSFPAYSQGYNSVSVYPVSFQDGAVECHYFRYPKDPKWTYTTLGNGTPIFNPSPNDYQDFELPIEDEPRLVAKILQYAGISIREAEVFQFGKIEEGATQPQQQ